MQFIPNPITYSVLGSPNLTHIYGSPWLWWAAWQAEPNNYIQRNGWLLDSPKVR